MKREYVHYVLLGALFAVAAAYQSVNSRHWFELMLHGTEMAAAPFDFSEVTPDVSGVRKSAADAGIRVGDRIVAVNGQPFTGRAVLNDLVNRSRPGDGLRVTVSHPNGRSQTVETTLVTRFTRPASASEWVVGFAIGILMPVFCILLGFWVAAIRPRDPLAWLLLGLMLSFSQNATPFDWAGPFRTEALVYHMFAGGLWAIWMMLFGIYFPERSRLELRATWVKFLLIVPLTAILLADIAAEAGAEHNFSAVASLAGPLRRLRTADLVLSMIAIGSFFANLSYSRSAASTPDARRRLSLLYTGATVSFAPMFVLVLRSLFRGGNVFEGVPEWIVLFALLLLFLFPVTMAYVIVVQRAMEVRVVIRQGVQYTLARGGVRVLQTAVTGAIVVSIFSLTQRSKSRLGEESAIIATGIALILVLRRLAGRLRTWTDKRFFREAYDAELILIELGEKVRTIVESGPLLETVTRSISDSLHVPRVAALLKSNGDYRAAENVGFGNLSEVRLPKDAAAIQDLRRLKQPTRIRLEDFPDSERGPLKALETQLLLPLSAREELLGLISLGPKRSEEPYTGTDLRLLQSVALQTGLALENSRLTTAIASEAAQRERLHRELEIAREVQERLFPQSLPPVSGLEYCGFCRPAQGVGGDYYDFLALPGGGLGIAIGDVSGKGISAALLMASLQASLRGQALDGSGDLDRLMRNVNRLVYDASASNRYATFFYAQYHAAARRLTYVNAGHNAPMLFRRDCDVIRLDSGGPVVGLFPQAPYDQATVQLEAGDLLVAFTDGISEAMNPDDEEWDEERLAAAVESCRHLNPPEIVRELMASADRFAAGAKQHDDMTLVVAAVRA